ncbi:hypothetical protein TUM4637_23780 [Shewanella hafniensis]|uniref:hypothetical protein n=1 Tax=Shewanella hafniensis TaxID=365590 RepID=UPI001BC55A21|nr:hypothetical protein [Shewanella hafniensis]MCL1136181.1 hypothetical protein [Shewanella hafniensis]GIU31692.1 hypothetical protein TUM4637_23780 [Shewanella hafniensis]
MQYSQLSKKAQRFINPDGLPEQLRLATKSHYVRRGLALLGLLPLSAPLIMAITLDGGEQTFYQFVVALLLPVVLILWAFKQHLVLDNPSQQRFVQSQFLGYHFKKAYLAPLKSTELLLRHDSYNRNQYELKLHNLVYPIGSLTDTTQAMMFFAQTFNLSAKEQITQFPNIRELDILSSNEQLIASLSLNCQDKPIAQEVDTINTVDGYSAQATDVKENGNLAHRSLSADIEPLWPPKLILKLFYPLPFIMAFGFAMKFIGSL